MYSIIGVDMNLNIYIQIAAYIALTAAFISSIFWIFLSYTWWKSEKKRIKKSRELNNI